MESSRKPISEIIAEAMPALNALRFFTATTRGFRDQEQTKLTAFLREVCQLEDYTAEEIMHWLKTKAGYVDIYDYRRGDVTQYATLLKEIPSRYLVRTRDYAMLIALGSGRKPLSDQLRERISAEFSEFPVIAPIAVEMKSELELRVTPNVLERH